MEEMGSIVDGIMVLTGIHAGLMLIFMTLKASESTEGKFAYQAMRKRFLKTRKIVAKQVR